MSRPSVSRETVGTYEVTVTVDGAEALAVTERIPAPHRWSALKGHSLVDEEMFKGLPLNWDSAKLQASGDGWSFDVTLIN